MVAPKIKSKSTPWDKFKQRLATLSDKKKGDAFERLVQAYLRECPTYKTKLRNVWLLNEVPQKVAQRLRLPGTDSGIDLVAETFDNKYWAIQCKYREDELASVKWKAELSTFAGLAFGICRGFDYALVCTSTERITKLLRNTDKFGIIAVDTWRHLSPELITSAIKAPKRSALSPFTPMSHQKRAIAEAHEHFIENSKDRGKLISPCGSGKSLTAFWINQKLGAKLTLIVVPSLALLKQTLNVWTREFVAQKIQPDWCCVCSDESAGDVEHDDFVTFPHDLGVPTTDLTEVTKWLKRSHAGPRIVFATYQSGKVIAQAARKAKTSFDLAVFDEAHKTAGRTDQLFAHLLFDKNVKVRKRMFMTATERFYRGTSDEIVGMNDPDIYGDTFHLLTFEEAINAKILTDYRLLIVQVDDKLVDELLNKRALLRLIPSDAPLAANTGAVAIAIRKAIEKYHLNHVISFHKSIRRAVQHQELQNLITSRLSAFRKIDVFHVSGRMPTSVRDRQIANVLGARPSMITNARCLTEGVDIKAIDGVYFADPKESVIDIVQAAGRAMRVFPGKVKGTIVVPLFVPAGGDPASLANSEFKHVLRVIRSLASEDDSIIDELKELAAGAPGSGKVEFISAIDPRKVSSIGRERFIKAISLQIFKRTARLKWRRFEDARAFVRSLGLRNEAEWRKFYTSSARPYDIPTNPHVVYRGKGWKNMGDWLGTGSLSPSDRRKQFLSFAEARTYVHKLKLKSQNEWKQYVASGKKPTNIPGWPNETYADNGWINWGDWLGTGTVANRNKNWRPFLEARAFARSLKFRSSEDWKRFAKSSKRPADIPSTPDRIYKEWRGWGDWLGTGNVASGSISWREFSKARRFVRSLGLAGQKQWAEFCRSRRKPPDIPTNPWIIYAEDGWKGLSDWLGTSNQPTRQKHYLPFEDARHYARSLKLASYSDWQRFARSAQLKPGIPKNPAKYYKTSGWVGWNDWLGIDKPEKCTKPRPFMQARKYARSLNLHDTQEWAEHCKTSARPNDIPSNPGTVYRGKGWKDWGDFLGTGRISNWHKEFFPFASARKIVHRLKLKNKLAWQELTKNGLPVGVPKTPDTVYKNDGWKDWGDWLGTNQISTRKRQYPKFPEARRIARSLKLTSIGEWNELRVGKKLPKELPAWPDQKYKGQGWKGWPDFLGY